MTNNERNGDQQPVTATDNNALPVVGSAEWGQLNQRRLELIQKKHRQGLTPEEQEELERLQNASRAALEEAFPRPPLDDDRLDRLEERLNAATEPHPQ